MQKNHKNYAWGMVVRILLIAAVVGMGYVAMNRLKGNMDQAIDSMFDELYIQSGVQINNGFSGQ